MQVTSLTYTMEGQAEPFHTADVSSIGSNGVVAPRTSYSYEFPYMADQAGGFNINVQMKAIINGEEFTFTDVLKLLSLIHILPGTGCCIMGTGLLV